MDSLTNYFNRQTAITLIPLWIFLLEDIAAIRATKRRKRVLNLQRDFWKATQTDSRAAYYRQIATCRPPAPRP